MAIAQSVPVQWRLLQPPPRRFVAAALTAVAVVAVALLRSNGESKEAPVAPPATTPVAPVAVQPSSPPLLTPPAEAALPPMAVHGVLASAGRRAAIIAVADSGQRRVPVGAQVAPGIKLVDVTPTGVVLSTGSSRYRLAMQMFGKTSTPELVAAQRAPDRAAALPAATGPALSRRSYADPALAKDVSLQLRLGLKPTRVGDITRGYRIVVADLPIFRNAGLTAGDLVLAINGSPFVSEEEVTELPDEIAQARTVIIDFERGGQRQSVTLEMAD
jgi:type II secretion system protein C